MYSIVYHDVFITYESMTGNFCSRTKTNPSDGLHFEGRVKILFPIICVWTNASQRLTMFMVVFQILGLDICADTLVGDAMRQGISGGQKKRVTTGNANRNTDSFRKLCSGDDSLTSNTDSLTSPNFQPRMTYLTGC